MDGLDKSLKLNVILDKLPMPIQIQSAGLVSIVNCVRLFIF